MTKKILVADDEIHITRILELNLSRIGYQVFIASDGLEAVQLFDSESPDLAILDIMMPGLTGLEVCREIRSRHGQSIPIIILTALSEGLAEDAAQWEVDEVITKPFSPRYCLQRVESLLKK